MPKKVGPGGVALEASKSEGKLSVPKAPASPTSVTTNIRAVREVQKSRTNATAARRKRNSATEWASSKDGGKATKVSVEKKSAETCKVLVAALKERDPFSTLDGGQLKTLVDVMVKVEIKAGDVVCKEGNDGNECYVVESGELKATVGGEEVDGHMTAGALLGEYTLFYNVPRTATVEAVAPSVLYKLDGASPGPFFGPRPLAAGGRSNDARAP